MNIFLFFLFWNSNRNISETSKLSKCMPFFHFLLPSSSLKSLVEYVQGSYICRGHEFILHFRKYECHSTTLGERFLLVFVTHKDIFLARVNHVSLCLNETDKHLSFAWKNDFQISCIILAPNHISYMPHSVRECFKWILLHIAMTVFRGMKHSHDLNSNIMKS